MKKKKKSQYNSLKVKEGKHKHNNEELMIIIDHFDFLYYNDNYNLNLIYEEKKPQTRSLFTNLDNWIVILIKKKQLKY